MSNIGGKRREQKEFGKLEVGNAEVKVILINPSKEQYKEVLGMELKDESKADEYLGESKDGNRTLRIDVWVENVKTQRRDKITYFLEDKKRVNKDGTKKQFINTVGSCSWADDENNLPDWFTKREYRQAYNGEEEFYNFMRSWLGNLDYRDAETTLQLPWKDLMKGKLDDIRSQIDGEYAVTFLGQYTVKSVEKDGDVKNFQSIYNRIFLPTYCMKNLRLVDYNKDETIEQLKKKKAKDLKIHEKYVLAVSDPEHGCKDSTYFGELKEFNEEDFLVANNEPLASDEPTY